MKSPVVLYLLSGVAALSLLAGYQFFGWSLTSVNEARGIPRSVRDNPGAYRSHYSFFRGK